MKSPKCVALTVLLLALAAPRLAPAATLDISHISGAGAFALLKKLAGEWHGPAAEPGAPPGVTVVYRVTAAGSAVVETLFPGTDHEMMTVYHMDKDKLVMTHYCAAGNQPHMKLAPNSTAIDLYFEFDGGTNLNPKKDPHMHAGHLHFQDADNLTAEWSGYQDGKPSDVKKLTLSRKK
jgi:hypothetical protein